MRWTIRTALFLPLLGVSAICAQTQTQNQQPAPAGSMDGMDMSKPAANGGTNGANSGKPMDMSHGDSMQMGCKMDMGAGSGQAMDMSHCMAMMKAGNSDLAKIPPGTLRVTFADKSTDWTADKLAALPHTSVTVHNEHTKADETYSGVPVIALLTPLGVTDKPRGKQLRLYVVASGSDGYEVVYAIGEVTPDVHDATVMVADTEDGKPIAADGPLKLVATGEKRPARWVRNLVSIEVKTAE